MDLSYTETQEMLRDTLARFLADTYSFEALSSELGLTCAPFAEELGGRSEERRVGKEC